MAIVPDPRIDPDPGQRRIIARDPRVVIVREQMDLDVGSRRLQVRENRSREQQIAQLVAFDDEYAHPER